MLYFLSDKKSCTACSACMNICPTNCISMVRDAEGFEYPVPDDRCVGCRECERVCPIENNRTESKVGITQFAVAAVTNDEKLWHESTSGGAFTEICLSFGDSETIVFGATFDGLAVVHDHVTGVSNVHMFRKSKYIQSSLSTSFGKVKEFLDAGRRVVFSGTPCQVAGLYAFLGKQYDNLLCIDLICHGVGSPKFFLSVIEFYEKKYGSKIVGYSFRHKKAKLGNLQTYLSRHRLENNRIYYVEKDVYNEFFLTQLCLRPSCGSNCKFRTSNRLSDITIADFKNKSGVFPKLRDHRNYSTIVVNSSKGLAVFNGMRDRMTMLDCDLDDIKRHNPLFYRQTTDNQLRDEFFNDYSNGLEMDLLIKKYLPPQREFGRKQCYKNFIPYRLKMWYRNLRSYLG